MTEKKEPVTYAVTVKLQYPIAFGSETISEIGLNRPKGKHLKNLQGKTDEEKALILASKLSGHPMPVFDEMDAVDIQEIAEVIGGFLANGRKVGEAP